METCKTSSTVAVDVGEHLFKVAGHSLVTGNTRLTSETFRVDGHDWAILYYPNGTVVDGQFASVFIQLVSNIESDVTASLTLCLQHPASPETGDKNKRSFCQKFSPSMTEKEKAWGFNQFISKDDLAASGCLEDDCLTIKCIVEISKLIHEDDGHSASIIVVPPSSLSADVRDILERGLKPDLTVNIGKSKSFNVNTCVLRARSPVFREQLCDFKMPKTRAICIDDMGAKVFEVLLYYIYSDCLPGFMEETTEEATSIAQDLLVAANRYGIERLKVMCERRLCQSLNVTTVCSTLSLAEQYNCQQLKQYCLKYMTRDGKRLRAIKKTDGFQQLIKNHPLVVSDILEEVIDKVKPQAATIPAPAQAPAP